MRVAIGSDHAGFQLKGDIIDLVLALGHDVIDLGADGPASVDYPDYAEKVGLAIQAGQAERGIMICGSGVGACIAANKMKGIYASLSSDTYSAHQGVEHDNVNLLCLGARIVGVELAKDIVRSFLNANFIQDERFIRRFKKVKAIEDRY